jgi:hypothetical protein
VTTPRTRTVAFFGLLRASPMVSSGRPELGAGVAVVVGVADALAPGVPVGTGEGDGVVVVEGDGVGVAGAVRLITSALPRG